MKNNEIAFFNSLEGRVIIADFKNGDVWDITDGAGRIKDDTPAGTDLTTAIKMYLTEIAFQTLKMSVALPESTGEAEEISWCLVMLGNLIGKKDEQLSRLLSGINKPATVDS